MGEVIDLSRQFARRQRINPIATHLRKMFRNNLDRRVKDEQALEGFIDELLITDKLPALDIQEHDIVGFNDWLQRLRMSRERTFNQALYYARLHMERELNLKVDYIPAAINYIRQDRLKNRPIALVILGMYSIVWQLNTGQNLVIDQASMEKRHST